ncbi:hypothetical protein DORLON_00370 [Dorea longicatena DSM 13814]|uniref:Uncharacterized protein n=1 Tax=Dorea longicatena DSM 13814 TaxID=411462 RepID=A6BDK4_9FIRM|nr:hypothetical protein DORLON_00370 [Dorea longicatena DSM 13814]
MKHEFTDLFAYQERHEMNRKRKSFYGGKGEKRRGRKKGEQCSKRKTVMAGQIILCRRRRGM